MSGNGNLGSVRDETLPERDSLFSRLHALAAQTRGKRALSLAEWVDLVTASRIAHALRECSGYRSAAARALGIGRRTLYTKMQKLGVEAAWELPAASE